MTEKSRDRRDRQTNREAYDRRGREKESESNNKV